MSQIWPVNDLALTDVVEIIQDSRDANGKTWAELADCPQREGAVGHVIQGSSWDSCGFFGPSDKEPRPWRRVLDTAIRSHAPHFNQSGASFGGAWSVLPTMESGREVNAGASCQDYRKSPVQMSLEEKSSELVAPIGTVRRDLAAMRISAKKYFHGRRSNAHQTGEEWTVFTAGTSALRSGGRHGTGALSIGRN